MNTFGRREFLRTAGGAGLGAALAPGVLRAADTPAGRRPNVVLIISDDMGYADMPGYGKDMEIPMPQMDRLRRGGVTLTDAYVSGPICVPSRMGIVTGRHQARWGVYTNVYGGAPFDRFQQEKTIAEYFRDAGYATALIGKWHLSGNGNIAAMPPEHRPDARGFDEIEIIPGGMSGYVDGPRLYHKGGTFSAAPEYLTDHFGKRAVDFIVRSKKDPFFLYLAFNAVHAPLHAPDEDVEAAGGLDGYDRSRYVPDLKVGNREPKMDRRVYGAMMRALDRNIGRVLDALDAAGVADDTLIFFVNDNGGPSLTSAVHSYNQASNAPYRGGKFDCLEGGVRVPMAIRWPGRVPADKAFSGLSSAMDILPTALMACGIARPEDRPLDGVNLLPFLDGSRAGDPHESLCWQIYFGNEKQTGQAAIRRGTWKLHQNAPVRTGPVAGSWALYDLAADPGETIDVAAANPDVVARLSKDWTRWRAGMADMDGR
jgi:arylsulfatase A-like enzyme